MKIDLKLSKFIFTSPLPILLFFIIPLLFILRSIFHIQLPLAASKYPLLYNNACLSLFVGIRFIYYLKGSSCTIRYGSDRGVPRNELNITQSASVVKGSLTAAGYHFDSSNAYAEKHDIGYFGTMLLYFGLFLVLFTGTLDNMRQFSGTLLHGVGAAVDLNTIDRYRTLVTGPLTSAPTTLPKMKIIRNIIPEAAYPLGAAESIFIDADGKQHKVVLKSPEPYHAGSYDIYMAKMLYEPKISVSIDGAVPVFKGKVLLWPLMPKIDNFGFYNSFIDGNLDGEVFYQPEKSRLKVVLRQGKNTLVDKELIFQVEQQQTSGNISFVCERMGVWSEIKVVRRRHMPIIVFGAVIALIGLAIRLTVRPQRVWMKELQQGCAVKYTGKDVERRLTA